MNSSKPPTAQQSAIAKGESDAGRAEMRPHTMRAFDADMSELVRMLSEMGGRANEGIARSVEALIRRNVALARNVIEGDEAIDRIQQQIEEKAIATVALRQPVAVDLRVVVAALRVSNELERIGDLAKNIAKRVVALGGQFATPKTIYGLRHMADIALRQLHEVLESFASRDEAKAMNVWRNDQEIDKIHTSLFRKLLTYAMEDPGTINVSVHILFCAKNIERIGDHITNIAEAVHYMVSGQPLASARPKADLTSSMPAMGYASAEAST